MVQIERLSQWKLWAACLASEGGCGQGRNLEARPVQNSVLPSFSSVACTEHLL